MLTLPALSPLPPYTQADNDPQLLKMWLHGRSPATQKTYASDINRFLACVGKALPTVTLGDLQGYQDTLQDLAPATQHRLLSAVKSLLSFGHKLGYLPVNVGTALRLPKIKDTLGERILTEEQVLSLIQLEPNRRNKVLLRLLYAAGLRVSELCGLKWQDVQVREEAGQIVVFGKGGKTRGVLLSGATWQELQGLRAGAGPEEPVFVSRKGGSLTPRQVQYIVQAAAQRAGIELPVSPHWLRHAHASHALDRGAPIAVTRDTLGHASLSTTNRYIHARPGESSARYLPV